MELSWIFIITVLAAGLALFDGIGRMRGRGGSNILAIIEIVAAILMLISIFVTIPGGTLLFAIILEVVLLLLLFIRGRGISIITVIALILNTIVIVLALGWVTIPAIQ